MKIIKRIAIWLGIACFFIFIASIVIAIVFEDEIGQQLVTEINKELVADLEVENFRLSLIKGFPNVSADLQNIILPDNKEGILLEAKSMSFNMGLMGLLTSNLKIKSVVIENGALFVVINHRGKANFLITKSSKNKTAATKSSFAISLDKAILKDIELIYVDERAKQEMKLQLDDAQFSGKFDNDQFSLISNASIRADFVELDTRRFFAGKKLGYEAKIYVDLENDLYEFQDVQLTVAKNSFNIVGTVEPHQSYTKFDLSVTADKGNIESVIQLLPEEYQYLEGFESRGNFKFDATVKGKLSAKEKPVVNLNFGLNDGYVTHTSLESAIQDVSFTANFKNGKTHSRSDAIFKIINFKGYFNRELIESQLKVVNLENPYIDFKMDGTLPLKSIYTFFESAAITNGQGEVEIRSLELLGKYSDMINPSRIHKVKASGIIEFDDASLTINDEKITLDKGILGLRGNELNIDELKLEGAGSEIIIEGSVHNFLPVLLADSINSKDAKLRFNATLKSESLDLDRLIAITEIKASKNMAAKEIIDSLKVENIQRKELITNFLEGKFVADVESFNYDLIEGESFSGNLEFKDKKMAIIGEAGAMGGSFDIDGTVEFEKLPKLKAKIVCNDINVKEFFRQSRNFGQEVLQSGHLEGVLNAKMVVSATWDTEGSFLYDELRVIAGIGIKDGELSDFGLLDEFSTYANSRDLKQVKFVDMQNWLEIQNERIYIPVMFVQSNAMNLLLSGEHTFNNDIDYNLKVNAGQVLLGKLKKHNPNLKPQPAKRDGLFNLYFNVSGTIDDYEVKTNKRKVKKEFTFSEYRKKAIQKSLEKEFGKAQVIKELKRIEQKIPDFKDSEGNEEYLDAIQGSGKNDF